ncbi:Protein zer-1, partial [Xenoophorus captivus]
VTGSKNEDQVLNAIEAYTEFRPELAHRAINQLFDIARIQHCSQLLRALQVTGSAALFYLTNTEYRSDQSVRLRREVIQVVLNGMEQYQEVTVQRNCCLTLCNFSIPEELEFQYSRVNQLLLKILEPARQDESIQRIACDQVMEFSWSALWNITDETPDNCQMFLTCRGMSLFLECLEVRLSLHVLMVKLMALQEFPDKQELHRNMLGLLGNVAEVKSLRPQLLTPQFITVFSNLLESKADGIEVSYNACGVLSHIMFDGPEVWTMDEPRRDAVMDRMWEAIQSWDVSSRRNINYRSFEPILRLLPQSIAPVSQHWATWALYNLVSVYREYLQGFTPSATNRTAVRWTLLLELSDLFPSWFKPLTRSGLYSLQLLSSVTDGSYIFCSTTCRSIKHYGSLSSKSKGSTKGPNKSSVCFLLPLTVSMSLCRDVYSQFLREMIIQPGIAKANLGLSRADVTLEDHVSHSTDEMQLGLGLNGPGSVHMNGLCWYKMDPCNYVSTTVGFTGLLTDGNRLELSDSEEPQSGEE